MHALHRRSVCVITEPATSSLQPAYNVIRVQIMKNELHQKAYGIRAWCRAAPHGLLQCSAAGNDEPTDTCRACWLVPCSHRSRCCPCAQAFVRARGSLLHPQATDAEGQNTIACCQLRAQLKKPQRTGPLFNLQAHAAGPIPRLHAGR